jgi:hypothetical protein
MGISMNERTARRIRVAVFAAIVTLAGLASAQTPPGCQMGEILGFYESMRHNPPWGPEHFVHIEHNNALWMRLRWSGGDELFTVGASPTAWPIDKNCMLEGDTLEVWVWKSCEQPAQGSFPIAPFPPQIQMNPVWAPPGVQENTVVVPWKSMGLPPRLRGVLLPKGEVLRDVEGWAGTKVEGTSNVMLPVGAEGVLKITLSACNDVQETFINLDSPCRKDCKGKCHEMPECRGDPVHTQTGNMLYEDIDPVPSNTFFPFRRTYLSTSEASGFFGARWFSMFDASLKIFDDFDGTRFVSITTEDRRVLVFSNRGGAFEEVGPGGVHTGKLVQAADGTWTQTDGSGRLQRVFDAQGVPIAFRDVAANREVRLSWNAGLPLRVEDSWGNWALNLTTDATARRITAISVDGRPDLVWNYVYGTHLQSVQSPAGSWRTYGYTGNSQMPYHRLITIRDGAGNVIESHTYESTSSGKAISSYGPSGDIDSIVRRQAGRNSDEFAATIHYTNGRTETHYRRLIAGQWRTVEVDGGCTTCGDGQYSVAFYDVHGNVIRAQGPDGYITETTYDEMGHNILN